MVHFIELVFVFIILMLVGLPLFTSVTLKELFRPRDYDLEHYKHLLVRKEETLVSIKELEFDFKTGKLSDEDFAAMKKKLEGEALAVLEEIDSMESVKKKNSRKSSNSLQMV